MAHAKAVVIGGGPAGATAARLLAEWGHSVTLLTAPPAGRALAECLPPSTQKVFAHLGIQAAVDAAGFFETTGNTVWWGARRRVEPYPAGSGYQVDRVAFDRLLLDLARSAGAKIRVTPGKGPNAPAPGAEAEFVLDCSGRAGVLGRTYRVASARRTIALCGVWRRSGGWRIPDGSHTLVESYGDGWAWSVPLSRELRHVAFMVDPVASKVKRNSGLMRAYMAELAKTRAFRRIFEPSQMMGKPWGRDASVYTARQFSGPNFVLAGDAGSFIDPLSSFGVKKALVSGWAAAVVANTCLRKPFMMDTALRFFDQREREIEKHYRKQSGQWFQDGSGAFWEARAETAAPTPGNLQGVLRDLQQRDSIRLRRAAGVLPAQRAGIEGREVVMREALCPPRTEEPLDFVANVEVVRLVELAPQHRQVPDLFEAYNRGGIPAALPDFLKALATLLAGGVLEHEPERARTVRRSGI